MELVGVVTEAFPLEQIILMLPEEDLAKFMKNDNLERERIMEQIKAMPPEELQKFIEGVTGMPMEKTGSNNFIKSLEGFTDDQFKEFMSPVDPDIQRQLTFQLTKMEPKYLTLFPKESYIEMMSKLMKSDMVKPMIILEKESLIKMVSELPKELMSIVACQIDPREFAKILQKGSNIDLIGEILMI
jgi:hypothetical protein